MQFRDEKIVALIKHKAAEFLALESNRTSLITVTNAALSSDESSAIIFITVLPTEKEAEALEFVKRQRSDFREFFKRETRVRRIPFFDFAIDKGEKNRQRIDDLSREDF